MPASGKRLILVAIAVSLSATAALAISILLFGDFGDTEGKVLATTAAISLYGLLALPGGILLDGRRLLPLAWATVGTAALGFVAAMAAVWSGLDSPNLGKLLLTLTAFAVATTQTAASASRRRAGEPTAATALFVAATGLVVALAAMLAVAVWAEVQSETYFRLLAAGAVANVLLVVLQPVVRRMPAAPARPSYALGLVLADGRERELELEARDFAEAVAQAIRETERGGASVERIERRSGA